MDTEKSNDQRRSLPGSSWKNLTEERQPIDDNGNPSGDRAKLRERDLNARLRNALNKLRSCEETTVADWNVDMSILGLKDNLLAEEAKLPRHVEENVQGIMQSAQDYVEKLEGQLAELDNADAQVEKSAKDATEEIDQVYEALISDLCREIHRKRDLLKLETEVYKTEGLAPLKACRQEVKAQIRSSQGLIDLIGALLKHPQSFNRERLGKIVNASSNMGRLPAVPSIDELPYITFSRPSETSKEEILRKVSDLGSILHMGPVQILDVEERPAGLFVKWHIIDSEYAAEEQSFVLQKANGQVSDLNSPAFKTVYEGSETSCFVRDLMLDCLITLRIGIQAADTAWSVHRFAKTTIPAYSWDSTNKNYVVTNNGRVAAKVTDALSTIFSLEAQFDANYIIEFTFLEVSHDCNDDEGIALLSSPQGSEDNLKRRGALFITPSGKIFMDGEEKLMKLPQVRLGTKLAITATRKDEETLRVNVECADKAVTYDWATTTPLHFAARFVQPNKWNVGVK